MKKLFFSLNFLLFLSFMPVYTMELQEVAPKAIQAEAGMHSLPDNALRTLMSFSTEEDKNALKCTNKFYSEHDFPSKSLIIGKEIRSFLGHIIELSMDDPGNLFDNLAAEHTEILSIFLHNDIEELLHYSDLPLKKDIIILLQKITAHYFSLNDSIVNVASSVSRIALNTKKFATEIHQILNTFILNINFNEIFPLSSLIDGKYGIDINRVSVSMQHIILDLLNNYLNLLNLNQKKRIIIAYLNLDPYSSQEDMIVAVLSEVGPIVQKLFQLLGQDCASVSLRKAMEKLQNNLSPIPLDFSIELINNALGDKFELFDGAEFTNLGAATVGQAILIKTVDNKEFIAKVRKPNICDEVKEDYDILINQVFQDSTGRSIVTQIYNNILQELDFRIEARNLNVAADLYNKVMTTGIQDGLISELRFITGTDKNNIEVPRIQYECVQEDVLVMSKAKGYPIAHFTSREELKIKLKALSEFFTLWFTQAIAGTGFFHADPHAGNIFLDIITLKSLNAWILTPIDFGACSYLTPEQQDSVVRFSLGVEWNNAKVICSAIHNLAENHYDHIKLFTEITKILSEEKNKSRMETLKQTKIMNALSELNIIIPESFILFIRGKKLLEQQINHVVNELGLDKENFMFHLIKKTIQESVGLKSINAYINASSDSFNDHYKVPCTIQ